MGLAYQLIGLIGSFVISSSLVPQMIKVYRTKSASDLSLTFQILYVVGLSMLLVYGAGEDLWPVYIPVGVELLGGVILLVMKLVYDAQKPGTVREKDSIDDDPNWCLEEGTSSEPSSSDTDTYRYVHTPRPQ